MRNNVVDLDLRVLSRQAAGFEPVNKLRQRMQAMVAVLKTAYSAGREFVPAYPAANLRPNGIQKS